MKSKKVTLPRFFGTPSSSSRNGMYAFTQQPSENQFTEDTSKVSPTEKAPAPSDLFSRFTADVIKKDVVFER